MDCHTILTRLREEICAHPNRGAVSGFTVYEEHMADCVFDLSEEEDWSQRDYPSVCRVTLQLKGELGVPPARMRNYTSLRIVDETSLESACRRLRWILDEAGPLDREAVKRRVEAYLEQLRAEKATNRPER